MTFGAVRKHKGKKDKKTHERKFKKKKKKEFNESVLGEEDGINDEEDSSEGNVDLNEELHPIGYYINDREEMINQMFAVIRGSKLRAMLPPILKDSTIDELKSQCLDELLGMSSKRIHSILEGRELETSSDSDEASSSPENDNTLPSSPTDNKGQWSNDDVTGVQDKALEEFDKEGCMGNERNGILNGPVPDVDTLEIGITKKEMGELLNYTPPTKQCERKRASSACETETAGLVAKRSKSKVNNQRLAKEAEKQMKGTPRKNTAEPEEIGLPSTAGSVNEEDMTAKTDESKGKTLLEILELEMRARAIRALLKQQTAGDGEDVETCDEESDTSPSEVNESSSINTACSTVGSGKDNVLGSKSFDTSPKPIRQKVGHKRRDNVPLNQCTVNAEHTNNLCCTASLKVSLDISAIPQLPSSTQNSELCSPAKTESTAGIKHSELNIDVDQAANGDGSRGSLCSSIKSEVIHGNSKTQDTDSIKSDLPFEMNVTEQKPKPCEAECKEIDKTVNATSDESDKEDGELSDDVDDDDDCGGGKKSSQSVLVVQPQQNCNDVIILGDSDDELLELNTSSKVQQTSVKQTCALKLSHEKLLEYGNDSSTRTEMSGTLNSASKECSLKCRKSSVPFETSGTAEKNLTQMENEEIFETEIDEHYTSENHCKRGDTSAECSWATRWLQSKDVQKVVSTSKMCAKIRKRMKSAHKVKKVISLTNDPEQSCKSSVVIVGSVNEYNMLDKPKSGNCETAENTSNSVEQNSS